jgi:hypothetical protein
MRMRLLASLAVAVGLVPGALLVQSPVAGQAPVGLTKPVVSPKVPRTPDGKPDMQGIWNAATVTPLERPAEYAGRPVLSEEEARKLEGNEVARVEQRAQPSDPNRSAPKIDGNVGGYNNFWIDRGNRVLRINGQPRASLIVDPPDGKVPEQVPEAKKRNAVARGSVARPNSDAPENAQPNGPGAYDDVELRPLAERCIMAFGSTSGPPTLPNYFYNNLKQVVQTPDHVMILIEMIHDARIIPIGKPRATSTIRKWMGDSVGRWDGDTFVVETTSFTNKTRFRGSSENLKVTERLTRTDENTLLYQFTVEDPATWPRPWSGEYTWVKSEEPIYEYACHEHNYALGDILRGERLLDAERTGEKVPQSR